MFDQINITHHIQKYIIGILIRQKYARFRDLRPPRVDTNLFTYHLTVLQKQRLVEKTNDGYSLTLQGLAYVDRVSIGKMNVRSQPKIITMLLVQNSDGEVLLQHRTKQPYIETWTLPYGKTHIEDRSLQSSACRESVEKLDYQPVNPRHVGDAYIRVLAKGEILSTTLAHIFRFETDDIAASDSLFWVDPLALKSLTLAPAVEAIITRSFFGDDHFFVELEEDWYS